MEGGTGLDYSAMEAAETEKEVDATPAARPPQPR